MEKKKIRYNPARKEFFFSELQSLLAAGLSFTTAFELLIGSEERKSGKWLYTRLYESVVRGKPLWQSMKETGGFSVLDYGIVHIGEETGRLAYVLEFLAAYYRKQIERRRAISGAITYPVVLLAMAVIVLVFMLLVIVPMFEQVYARMGGELPAITARIIRFSRHFPFWLTGTLLVLLAAMGVWRLYGKKAPFRAFVTTVLLRCPGIGKLIRRNQEVRFCQLLYLLQSSGIPLLKSVGILESIFTFYPYQVSLEYLGEGLKKGESLAVLMEQFPLLYDRKLCILLKVGEETNRLGDMLRREGEELSRLSEYEFRQMSSLLEPLLVLGIGTVVAFILISMYLPMFRMGAVIY